MWLYDLLWPKKYEWKCYLSPLRQKHLRTHEQFFMLGEGETLSFMVTWQDLKMELHLPG